jgi:hypothetical protein
VFPAEQSDAAERQLAWDIAALRAPSPTAEEAAVRRLIAARAPSDPRALRADVAPTAEQREALRAAAAAFVAASARAQRDRLAVAGDAVAAAADGDGADFDPPSLAAAAAAHLALASAVEELERPGIREARAYLTLFAAVLRALEPLQLAPLLVALPVRPVVVLLPEACQALLEEEASASSET